MELVFEVLRVGSLEEAMTEPGFRFVFVVAEGDYVITQHFLPLAGFVADRAAV